MSEAQLPEELQDGKDVNSNWFKFEKVGDFVKGTLINRELRKSTNVDFQDQWVYTLRKADGTEVFVPVQRANSCPIGEIISFFFEKEIPASSKARKPAKALRVMSHGFDENYAKPKDVFDSLDDILGG